MGQLYSGGFRPWLKGCNPIAQPKDTFMGWDGIYVSVSCQFHAKLVIVYSLIKT
jgi:hypothetical protein